MYNNKRIKKKADEGKVIVKKLYIHILKKQSDILKNIILINNQRRDVYQILLLG